MDIKILVATHKQFEIITSNDIYYPMLGGASLYPDMRFGYGLDNDGINISDKKENYNELTSLFWLWKNSDSDIKGLCHYRRYFVDSLNISKKPSILTKETIEKILTEYDAILPYPVFHKKYKDNYEQLINTSLYESDFNIIKKEFYDFYPEYKESFDSIMSRRYLCPCNMIIANRDVYDEYCLWLFNFLFTLESKISLDGYSPYYIRMYGFLGERLLNVWFHHNKKKVKFMPIVLIEQHDNLIKNFIYDVKEYAKYTLSKINHSDILKNHHL